MDGMDPPRTYAKPFTMDGSECDHRKMRVLLRRSGPSSSTNERPGDLMNGFYETMRSKGFSYETTASVRKFNCPNCNFNFSLVYARTFACQGCSEAVRGCPKVRCAKCDCEFFINETPEIHGKEQQRAVADHISNVVNQHYDGLGIRTYNR